MLNAQFKREWDVAVKNIEKLSADVVRKAAIELLDKIIIRTPVGNPILWQSPPPAGYEPGQLRGAWTATLNSPANGTSTDKDTGGSKTLAKAKAGIAGYNGKQNIYLTNNEPYAYRVEYGWSNQAPAGMTRVSVQSFDSILNKVVRENRKR